MSQSWPGLTNQTVQAAIQTSLSDRTLALRSLHSGAVAPTSTVAYMLWADTGTNTLWIRNAADSGWVRLGNLAVAGYDSERIQLDAIVGGVAGNLVIPFSCDLAWTVTDLVMTPDTATSGSAGGAEYSFDLFNVTQGVSLFSVLPVTSTAESPAQAVYKWTADQNQALAVDDYVEFRFTIVGPGPGGGTWAAANVGIEVRGFQT